MGLAAFTDATYVVDYVWSHLAVEWSVGTG